MDLPKKGRYRHFKGGEYELIYIARHSETDESMVVYRAEYECGETPNNERIWVRPLSMWTETVAREGKTFPRFQYIGDAEEAGKSEEAFAPADELAPPSFEEPELFYGMADEAVYAAEDAADYFAKDTAPEPRPSDMIEALPETKSTASLAEARALYGEKILQILSSVYGYKTFREGQEEMILSILSGRDSLGVMPTGAGKSLCYQIPALALEGVSLVISPLISLMKDQVSQLRQSGVAAAYINSSLSESQQEAALARAMNGAYKIIYVAPERLLTPRFQLLCRSVKISLVAVDEAHCISQWGQDFRPSYLDIPRFLNSLSRRPRVCAFTATATERVREDICRLIGLKHPYLLITGFDRPNLYYRLIHTSDKRQALNALMRTYADMSGIIYCATRKQTEEVCALLNGSGYRAARYHAGLSEEERRKNQEAFSLDEIPVMVATNAFGMGIDKSNVRFVIHYAMPKDIESYYQEAGRAGRDGLRADCALLYSPQDVVTQRFMIDHLGEEAGLSPQEAEPLKRAARERLGAMKQYASGGQCLRHMLLNYFGQPSPEKCGCCGVCDGQNERVDATEAAREALGLVEELRYSFGAGTLNEVLRGANTEAVRRRKLNALKGYGALGSLKASVVSDILDAMVEAGALKRSQGEYPTLSRGPNAEALRNGEIKITIAKPAEKEKKPKAKPFVAPANGSLLTALKALRMQLARERHVAPFMIFSDASLISMTEVMPRTREEFMRVSGVGERKCRDFADAFTACIQNWQDENR